MLNQLSKLYENCSEVRVEGLETLDYLNNMCKKERFTEQGDALTFESEVIFEVLSLYKKTQNNFLCHKKYKNASIFIFFLFPD